jgi:hypothetical protein
MRGVTDGERTIVTRHLAPRGVLLSVRDAIELSVSVLLAQRADAASQEDREGMLEDRLPDEIRPRQILFSAEAKCEFDALTKGQQGMIKALLRRTKSWEPSPKWTSNGRWLVGYDLPESRLAIVHAVLDGWEAEDALLGPELRRARDGQDLRRSARMRGGGTPRLSRARRGP